MNYLVTGGQGLIGHNVVRRLLDQNHNVVIVDSNTDYGILAADELKYLITERTKKVRGATIYNFDLVETEKLNRVFAQHNFDVVIHLASFPRQKVVNVNPALGARVMTEALLSMLEMCVAHKVSKFVYASSSMVYGNFNHCIKEEEPCHPQGQYGIMKYMGEKLVEDYQRRGLLKSIIIRPSAVYGPLDVEDRVISKFILTAMRGGTLKVKGKNEMLDFTFVDDAADGIVAASLSEIAYGNTYNITKGASTTLYEAAQLAVSIVGKGDIVIEDKDDDFPSRAALDISKAQRDFNYNPAVDVKTGFVEYYRWISTSTYWKEKLEAYENSHSR
jgi:nucleoside-diphosphate-sugar epimerase